MTQNRNLCKVSVFHYCKKCANDEWMVEVYFTISHHQVFTRRQKPHGSEAQRISGIKKIKKKYIYICPTWIYRPGIKLATHVLAAKKNANRSAENK